MSKKLNKPANPLPAQNSIAAAFEGKLPPGVVQPTSPYKSQKEADDAWKAAQQKEQHDTVRKNLMATADSENKHIADITNWLNNPDSFTPMFTDYSGDRNRISQTENAIIKKSTASLKQSIPALFDTNEKRRDFARLSKDEKTKIIEDAVYNTTISAEDIKKNGGQWGSIDRAWTDTVRGDVTLKQKLIGDNLWNYAAALSEDTRVKAGENRTQANANAKADGNKVLSWFLADDDNITHDLKTPDGKTITLDRGDLAGVEEALNGLAEYTKNQKFVHRKLGGIAELPDFIAPEVAEAKEPPPRPLYIPPNTPKEDKPPKDNFGTGLPFENRGYIGVGLTDTPSNAENAAIAAGADLAERQYLRSQENMRIDSNFSRASTDVMLRARKMLIENQNVSPEIRTEAINNFLEDIKKDPSLALLGGLNLEQQSQRYQFQDQLYRTVMGQAQSDELRVKQEEAQVQAQKTANETASLVASGNMDVGTAIDMNFGSLNTMGLSPVQKYNYIQGVIQSTANASAQNMVQKTIEQNGSGPILNMKAALSPIDVQLGMLQGFMGKYTGDFDDTEVKQMMAAVRAQALQQIQSHNAGYFEGKEADRQNAIARDATPIANYIAQHEGAKWFQARQAGAISTDDWYRGKDWFKPVRLEMPKGPVVSDQINHYVSSALQGVKDYFDTGAGLSFDDAYSLTIDRIFSDSDLMEQIAQTYRDNGYSEEEAREHLPAKVFDAVTKSFQKQMAALAKEEGNTNFGQFMRLATPSATRDTEAVKSLVKSRGTGLPITEQEAVLLTNLEMQKEAFLFLLNAKDQSQENIIRGLYEITTKKNGFISSLAWAAVQNPDEALTTKQRKEVDKVLDLQQKAGTIYTYADMMAGGIASSLQSATLEKYYSQMKPHMVSIVNRENDDKITTAVDEYGQFIPKKRTEKVIGPSDVQILDITRDETGAELITTNYGIFYTTNGVNVKRVK